MQQSVKSFLKLYEECIDENGNARACGREKCKSLIVVATVACDELGISTLSHGFGNETTGVMNVPEMTWLYSSISNIFGISAVREVLHTADEDQNCPYLRGSADFSNYCDCDGLCRYQMKIKDSKGDIVILCRR